MKSLNYVKEKLVSAGLELCFRVFNQGDLRIQNFLNENSQKISSRKEKYIYARKVINLVVVEDISSMLDFDPCLLSENSKYIFFLEEIYLLAIRHNRFLKHIEVSQDADQSGSPGFKSPFGDIFEIQSSLKNKIIGQDFVVDILCKELIKKDIGLHNPSKPPSFILLGQTGTGKTYFVEQLTEALYGEKDRLLKINCSKYGQPHEVANLIGSPKGYVGSKEHGIFYRHLNKYADAIVLFDEIEKANDKLFELLLPITDKGEIEDNDGNILQFKDCLIFFTSNLGAHGNVYKDFDGYVDLGDESLTGTKGEYREQINFALNECFSPEFINRIKDVLCFNSLTRKDIQRILKIELAKISERLERNNMKMRLTEKAMQALASECYSEIYGARELERMVDRLVTSPLAESIYKRDFNRGDNLLVTYKPESGFVFQKDVVISKKETHVKNEALLKNEAHAKDDDLLMNADPQEDKARSKPLKSKTEKTSVKSKTEKKSKAPKKSKKSEASKAAKK